MKDTVTISTEEYWELKSAYITLTSDDNLVFIETTIRRDGILVFSMSKSELINELKEENDRLSRALTKCYEMKCQSQPPKKWYQIWK